MSDSKWIVIATAVMMILMIVAMTLENKIKVDCKIEAVKNHVSAIDAVKLCQ